VIVGDPSVFAIESGITEAYQRISFRALGYFVVHIGGRRYGVNKPDATMLACSLDEVGRRLKGHGAHVASFATEDASEIANSFCSAFYADEQKNTYFGIPASNFIAMFNEKQTNWAPDGDEAFDDGSFILQFDTGEKVRLIAFKRRADGDCDTATLSDLWISAEDFYSILQRWHASFEAEWASTPKAPNQK
jgi:hypothetical protein